MLCYRLSHTHFNIKPSRSMWLFYGQQVLMADSRCVCAVPKTHCRLSSASLVSDWSWWYSWTFNERSSNVPPPILRENAWAIIHPSKCLFTPPESWTFQTPACLIKTELNIWSGILVVQLWLFCTIKPFSMRWLEIAGLDFHMEWWWPILPTRTLSTCRNEMLYDF